MNKALKHRLFCIGLFLILNVLYYTLLFRGLIQTEGAILYGVAGVLWALRLRQSRSHYRRRSRVGP